MRSRKLGEGSGWPRRAWTRHKWLAVTGAVIVVAGTGGGVWAATTGSSTPSATSTTETVSTSTIRQTVSASGTLASASEADLSFAASGQVTDVLVAPGAKVTKGQPLARITSASLAASVAQAQVSVANAQSRLSSDQTAGATADQLTADQQSLTVAQDSLTDSQQALAGATMTAPFTGTIASVDLTVGEQVSGSGSSSGTGSSGGGNGGGSNAVAAASTSSSSSGSSSAQIVLIDPVHFTIAATVDDTQIDSIKSGLQAVITPNGGTSVVYGTVSSVGLIASSTSGVTSYPVTIQVTGAQPTLHPGASASVAIVVRQLTDVLAIPTAAIHYTGAAAYVTKETGGRKLEAPVTIGTASGAQTQITKGLSAGDTIVVPVTRAVGGAGGAGTRTRTGTSGFGGGGFGGGGFGGGNVGGGGLGR